MFDGKPEPYQVCVVVRSTPQYISQRLLSPVAGLQVSADAIPDQEVDQGLAFLAFLDREELDHLRRDWHYITE